MTVSCRLAVEEEAGCVRAGEGGDRYSLRRRGQWRRRSNKQPPWSWMKMLQNLRSGPSGGLAEYTVLLSFPSICVASYNELMAHNAGRNWHLPRGTNERMGRGFIPPDLGLSRINFFFAARCFFLLSRQESGEANWDGSDNIHHIPCLISTSRGAEQGRPSPKLSIR